MNNDFVIQTLKGRSFCSPLDSNMYLDKEGVLLDPIIKNYKNSTCHSLEMAGPRKRIVFDPKNTRAAIVTCGGLCPGLNDVIRAVTVVLWRKYGVKKILGLKYGYEGLNPRCGHKPLILTPDTVEDIHKDGGTILGSSRGQQDVDEMVDFLQAKRINILFTVGGDGTQRGALALHKEITKRKARIAIIGIPKTIDNDLDFTDRTFGFETAVAASREPITCAHREAKGAKNGIGLVKLMGRESGFVAAYAALASSDVNLLLVPEAEFSMPKLLTFLERRLQRKAHAVIVVAEGAGQEYVQQSGTDASGNKKLGDIGLFLKTAISDHFKTINFSTSVKYIDPSYIIRSLPASADDSVFCFQLAENAVHAAMAGKTNMVIGLRNNVFVHIPIEKATGERKKIDINSLFWQSVLNNTGQPYRLV